MSRRTLPTCARWVSDCATSGGSAGPSFDLQFPPRTLTPGGPSLGQNVGPNGDRVPDVQTLGPRGTPAGSLVHICPDFSATRTPPMESTDHSQNPLVETHAGLRPGRVRAARLVPRPGLLLLAPGLPSCLVPSPSALSGTFSFCFRGISTFATATSDSKSASLRSFPGITQHKLCRPTSLVHRVERKRKRCPYSPPSFRHFL